MSSLLRELCEHKEREQGFIYLFDFTKISRFFFSPFLSGLKNLIYQTVGDTSKITSGAEKTISFLHSVIRNGRAKYSGATSQLPEQGHNLRDINALLSPDFSAVTQPLSLRVALREFSLQR